MFAKSWDVVGCQTPVVACGVSGVFFFKSTRACFRSRVSSNQLVSIIGSLVDGYVACDANQPV